MTMAYSILPSEIDFTEYSFDFEEYVKNEMGLDIISSAKKNGGKASKHTNKDLSDFTTIAKYASREPVATIAFFHESAWPTLRKTCKGISIDCAGSSADLSFTTLVQEKMDKFRGFFILLTRPSISLYLK